MFEAQQCNLLVSRKLCKLIEAVYLLNTTQFPKGRLVRRSDNDFLITLVLSFGTKYESHTTQKHSSALVVIVGNPWDFPV